MNQDKFPKIELLCPCPGKADKLFRFEGVAFRITSVAIFIRAFPRISKGGKKKYSTLLFSRKSGRIMQNRPRGGFKGDQNIFPWLRLGQFIGESVA